MTSEQYAQKSNEEVALADTNDEINRSKEAVAQVDANPNGGTSPEGNGEMTEDEMAQRLADYKNGKFKNVDVTPQYGTTPQYGAEANVGPMAPDWKSQTPAKIKPIQKHDVAGNVIEGGDYRNKVVQSGPRTGTTLYFGNAGAMPEVVNVAGNVAEAQRPIGTVEGDAIDSLQRQGWANRKQNAYKNDAIVTGALVSLYNTWKGDSADGTGRVRTGLEADAVRAVNAQLQGANAGYRVTGMSCIGEEGGEPVFRVFTIDRNGKKSMHLRTAQEVYNTRLSALSNGNVQQADAKGTPGAIEGNLIKSFGDFNGVQRRYETINRDQIEKERAAKAQEEAEKQKMEYARVAAEREYRIKAAGVYKDITAGDSKMSLQQFRQRVMTDSNALEFFSRGEPVYETDKDGKLIKDSDGKPIQATDAEGKPLFKRLTPEETSKKITDIYNEGQKSAESGLSLRDQMAKFWEAEATGGGTGGAAPSQTPPLSDGTGGAKTPRERAAEILAKRRSAAGVGDSSSTDNANANGSQNNRQVAFVDYGLRNDGKTYKGTGWLGELKTSDGGVATEYTSQSEAVKVNGKRIDFPTLVPGLSQEQVSRMVNDIIPNEKPVPDDIMQIAIDHANKMISEGKSVFANDGVGRIPTALDYVGVPSDLAAYKSENVIRPVAQKKTQTAKTATAQNQVTEPKTSDKLPADKKDANGNIMNANGTPRSKAGIAHGLDDYDADGNRRKYQIDTGRYESDAEKSARLEEQNRMIKDTVKNAAKAGIDISVNAVKWIWDNVLNSKMTDEQVAERDKAVSRTFLPRMP